MARGYDRGAGRLGPYVLVEVIGQGAMARVWRAWDPALRREVALKEPLLDPRLPDSTLRDMGQRFVAEARVAAFLRHPNIVGVYAAGVWDGGPAIAMELVEGVTLSRLIRLGPVEPARVLSVLDQLLDAVGFAHDRGVVHRDVKPDNVFVTPTGVVKLSDFGVAHVGNGMSAAVTVAGDVIGTPGYMSPEQARGLAVDARSDLFSVGVVGYEMLTGRNPFGAGEGVDAATLLYRIVHEPVPPLPYSCSRGLPHDPRPAIAAALSKDPAARPQTAADFKRMLHSGTDLAAVSTQMPRVSLVEPVAAAAGTPPHAAIARVLPYLAIGGACAAAIAALLAWGGGCQGKGPGSALAYVQSVSSSEAGASAADTGL